MRPIQTPTIDHRLWEAISSRAARERLSAEAWLARQVADIDDQEISYDGCPITASEDEAVLELALNHFRGLDPSPDDARALADAIFATIETGEAHAAGPVGVLQRRYLMQRRASAVSIRVGEGRISLPLEAAMRLAGALRGPVDLRLRARIAA